MRTPPPRIVETRTYIREAIRAAMADRGATQTGVARAIGMPQSSMSHRLSGRGAFTIEELLNIAELLEVDPVALLPNY